jgi:2-C-methyl-D-erythritol 2,4-cyclodiphosphate synthase
MNIRVGFGFDVHVLDENRPMWLGGILLEDAPKGALGHSDADVLLHAICDALLGAANMRDIGFHFSNTSDQYKNIDSKILLSETLALINTKGYRVINIDATVVLEKPKINPHITKMQTVIAELLKIDSDAVSIKATTSEKLGYVGREEGVNASAVALIIKD